MNKLKENQKGFTLIELIVVVAILAVLAAVAVPNFMGMTQKANTATEVAAAAEVANAINIYNALEASGSVPAGAITAATAADAQTKLSVATVKLWPSLDSSLTQAKINTNVLARITITNRVASVTNKNAI